MPRHCSVSYCKSNYNSQKQQGTINTFAIPKNEPLRSQWLNAIPNDISKCKNPAVCVKHFDPSLIIRTDVVMYKGKLREYPRVLPKLKEDAVPSIFTDDPVPSIPSKKGGKSKEQLTKARNVSQKEENNPANASNGLPAASCNGVSCSGSSSKRLAEREKEQYKKAIALSLEERKKDKVKDTVNTLNGGSSVLFSTPVYTSSSKRLAEREEEQYRMAIILSLEEEKKDTVNSLNGSSVLSSLPVSSGSSSSKRLADREEEHYRKALILSLEEKGMDKERVSSSNGTHSEFKSIYSRSSKRLPEREEEQFRKAIMLSLEEAKKDEEKETVKPLNGVPFPNAPSVTSVPKRLAQREEEQYKRAIILSLEDKMKCEGKNGSTLKCSISPVSKRLALEKKDQNRKALTLNSERKMHGEKDTISTLDGIYQYLLTKGHETNWVCVLKDDKAVLCLMDVNELYPKIKGCISVDASFDVTVYVHGCKINRFDLPKKASNVRSYSLLNDLLNFVEHI